MTARPPDGAGVRKKKTVNSFYIDEYAVSNKQFHCFVQEMSYVTETEGYGWSFVFESFASKKTIEDADNKDTGL